MQAPTHPFRYAGGDAHSRQCQALMLSRGMMWILSLQRLTHVTNSIGGDVCESKVQRAFELSTLRLDPCYTPVRR